MKQFGLIGRSLQHSFSKQYFEKKFSQNGIQDTHTYDLIELSDINQLPGLIEKMPNLKGLNVTIPYKESVIPYLNELDTVAAAIGAVNCIKIYRNESGAKLIGYNTDAFGFEQSLKPFLTNLHEKALILGNGGASKAIKYVLKSKGIFIANVVRDKAKFQEQNLCFIYDEISEYILSQFKLIVNTSPVGTFPKIDEAPSIPYEFLSEDHLCYDLVYNPEQTMFMKKSNEYGASTVNGLSMLQWQAEKAWEFWNI